MTQQAFGILAAQIAAGIDRSESNSPHSLGLAGAVSDLCSVIRTRSLALEEQLPHMDVAGAGAGADSVGTFAVVADNWVVDKVVSTAAAVGKVADIVGGKAADATAAATERGQTQALAGHEAPDIEDNFE